MLKICGIVLIIAASSLTGACLSLNLSRRVNEIEGAILLMEQMQTCLRYGQVPTVEMLERLSEGERFVGFTFLGDCLSQMKNGCLFPEAWKRSLQGFQTSRFSKKDKEVLGNIADILGGSDFESQIEALELNISLLRQNLQEAMIEKNTAGKLYRSLGILLGIGVAVFMI